MTHIDTAYEYGCQKAVADFQVKLALDLEALGYRAADFVAGDPRRAAMMAGGAAGALGGMGIGAAAAGKGKRGRGALIGGATGALAGTGAGYLGGGKMDQFLDTEQGGNFLRKQVFGRLKGDPMGIPTEYDIKSLMPNVAARTGINSYTPQT